MSKRRKDSSGRVLRKGEYQRSNGSYEYRYTDPQQGRCSIYAPTLEELRAQIGQIERDRADGIDQSRCKATVSEQLTSYFELKQNVRESTRISYRTLLHAVQKTKFASRRVVDVKMTDAKRYCVLLYQNGYAFGTIQAIHCHLRCAFQMAVDDDYIRKNPFGFSVSKVLNREQMDVKALDVDEKTALLDVLSRDGPLNKYYDPVVILIGTGMRISELCGLTIQDVDFAQSRVRIERQLLRHADGGVYVSEPKTESSIRYIPMSPDVRAAFMRVCAARPKPKIEWFVDGVSGFLFIAEDGKPLMSYYFQRAFKSIEKKVNKTYGMNIRLTPHVLRHTFCTDIVNSGMNIKSVQYITGHSSLNVLLKVYTDARYSTIEEEFMRACVGR